jgi:hypothetical protein
MGDEDPLLSERLTVLKFVACTGLRYTNPL